MLNVIPVIPCFNEDWRLEATIQHLICGEGLNDIVVVDDISTDDGVERLMHSWESKRLKRVGEAVLKRGPCNIHVLRGERKGVGESRNIGGNKAFALGATTAYFMDAHVAANPYDVLAIAATAERLKCAVSPACLGWHTRTRKPKYGGNLGYHERRALGVGYIKSLPPPDSDMWEEPGLLKINALIGANGYAIPRGVWNKIGGWSKNLGLWGFNEQLISSKLFFAGVPIMCDTTRFSRHYFKTDPNECINLHTRDRWYARWAVLYYLFGDVAFKKVWFPMMAERWSNCDIQDRLKSKEMQKMRAEYQALKVKSDKEWFQTFFADHKELWEGKV